MVQRGCGDDRVMSAYELSTSGQVRVKLGMAARNRRCKVQYGNPRKDGFDKFATAPPSGFVFGPVDPHQQFRDGHRTNEDTVGRLPLRSVDGEPSPLTLNEYVGVNHKPHGAISAGNS